MNENIGILDKEFKHSNPLTGESYSEEYKELFNKLTGLAAYNDREKVINAIQDNQVIIIQAMTGVGKTVWVPKFALHALNYQNKIAVTNPKKITTKSNATFMAKSLDVQLGKQVGYKYKGSPKDSYSKDTKLLFATDGYLAAKILGDDPLLSEYSAVILDEIHERKVNMDLLLYLLKDIVKRRKDFKLILVSATLNEKLFQDYYPKDEFKIDYLNLEVPTTYPIEVHFSKEPINNYIVRGVEKIIEILKESTEGDILFFVTSKKETTDVCKLLNEKTETKNICIEIYSGMDPEQEKLAQDPILYKKLPGDPQRKLLIATNVVESSLTVEGLKYVIDSGKELFFYYDPKLIARVMKKQFTTQAQVKQRRGRVGRTAPGICYHLFTEEEYEKMRDYPLSEIQKTDITLDILRFLKNEKTVENVKNLLQKFIEPPNENLIKTSFKILYLLNAIDNNTDLGKITKTGENLLETRINDVYMSKAFLKSFKYGCPRELAIISALVELTNYKINEIFKKVATKNIKKKNEKIKKFIHKTGDHLTLLNIYHAYNKKKYELRNKLKDKTNIEAKLHKWCMDNYLQYDILSKVYRLVKDYLTKINNIFDMSDEDIKKLLILNRETDKKGNEECILESLFRGLYINIGVKKNNIYKLKYRDDKMSASISKTSYCNSKSKVIIFNELFVSRNAEMNMVTTIPTVIYKKYQNKIKID
jgi:pre-mRNA-splicing factor ATP-dependent RNA helicase DHX15/PRP43